MRISNGQPYRSFGRQVVARDAGAWPAGQAFAARAMMQSAILRRYLKATSLLVAIPLVVFGGLESWFTYEENVKRMSERQQLEARSAKREVELSLSLIEEQVKELARLPWDSGLLTDLDRREEFYRLQKLAPVVHQLRAVDASGQERVFVSRTEPERVGSRRSVRVEPADASTAAASPTYYSPVSFRNDSEPFTSLVVREGPDGSAATIAELDLRHLARLLSELHVGRLGTVFILDMTDRVIAHPNMSKTLLHRDLSKSSYIHRLRQSVSEQSDFRSFATVNHEGEDVLATAIRLGSPPWLVVVEEPLREAMTPVRQALLRTLGLLAAGLTAAFATSLWLARRLTHPVVQLRDQAVQVGSGDLTARIESSTDDELGVVAGEFNRMAAKLQASYAELEQKVEERTTELARANRELADRRDEADRANAAKTRFLASASHDLRQPMHTISLLVGTLKEQSQGRQIANVVRKIESSIGAMESLFGSLLDISKLDAGVVKPNVAEVALGPILRNLEIQFAPQAHAKNLVLRIEPCSVIVESDAALLERILSNLVANAINYTTHGAVVVGCRVRNERAHLLVADSGVGIPAHQINDAFDEFVQLDNPGRDRSKGLGLGLSIVKRTADLLGHRLIARSIVGKGSVFGVEMPFVAHESAADAPSVPAGSTAQSLRGSFVAVIDDVEENRFAMEALCRQWGCLVVSAGGGSEIMRSLSQHLRSPDLVISDYRLRDGETGLDVIEEIRHTAEVNVPAIVVTGDISASNDPRFSSAGVILLHKPLNPQQLLRAAETLLASSPAPDTRA